MTKKKVDFTRKPQDQIFRLHIALEGAGGTEPLVWRRVLVPGLFTLEALHSVIQLVMGWQMKHLYDFRIGNERFAEPDESDEKPVRGLATSLASAIREHKSFHYNYDFGDDWSHLISVEEIMAKDEGFNYPICVGGENACPPEDCGGPHGYVELREKIAKPNHPEYQETIQWLGGYYDPKSFDANRINRDMLWMVDWQRGPNDQGLYLPFNGMKEEEPEERYSLQ